MVLSRVVFEEQFSGTIFLIPKLQEAKEFTKRARVVGWRPFLREKGLN